MQSHEPVIGTVMSRGHQMVKSGHFAVNQVEVSLQTLQTQLTTLKDDASVRRLRLLDAVESQMFYTEADEAEAWIRERRPLLSTSDLGKDEDSVTVKFDQFDTNNRSQFI